MHCNWPGSSALSHLLDCIRRVARHTVPLARIAAGIPFSQCLPPIREALLEPHEHITVCTGRAWPTGCAGASRGILHCCQLQAEQAHRDTNTPMEGGMECLEQKCMAPRTLPAKRAGSLPPGTLPVGDPCGAFMWCIYACAASTGLPMHSC